MFSTPRTGGITLGKAGIQTAADRFGPEGKTAVRDRERVSFGMPPIGMETPFTWPSQDPDKPDVPAGKRSIYRTVPSMQAYRNNLTALSQTCNLYFVAYQGRIFVYRPRAVPERLLTRFPELHLVPRKSRHNLKGALDPHRPHTVNHIITGMFGEREIVVACYDSGDVVAYDVKEVWNEVLRKAEERSYAAGKGHEFPQQPHATTKPFFSDNVGRSAWGLAVHSKSRLIAVSSNLHEVTVFAMQLSTGPPQSKVAECEGCEDKAAQVKQRQRAWRIIIVLGISASNIPNIAFLDDEQGEAEKVCGMDINGKMWIADIWRPMDYCAYLTAEPTREYGRLDRGWGVVPLPVESFLVVSRMTDLLGGNPKLVDEAQLSSVVDISPLLTSITDDPYTGLRRKRPERPDRLPSFFYELMPPAVQAPSSALDAISATLNTPATSLPTAPEQGNPFSSGWPFHSGAAQGAAGSALTGGPGEINAEADNDDSTMPDLQSVSGSVDDDDDEEDEDEGDEGDGEGGEDDDEEDEEEDEEDEDEDEEDEDEDEEVDPDDFVAYVPPLLQASADLEGSGDDDEDEGLYHGDPDEADEELDDVDDFFDEIMAEDDVGPPEDTIPHFEGPDLSQPVVTGPGPGEDIGQPNTFTAWPASAPTAAGTVGGPLPVTVFVYDPQPDPPPDPPAAGPVPSQPSVISTILESLDWENTIAAMTKHVEELRKRDAAGAAMHAVKHKPREKKKLPALSSCCGARYLATDSGPLFLPMVYLPHEGSTTEPRGVSLKYTKINRRECLFKNLPLSDISRRYRFLTTYATDVVLLAPESTHIGTQVKIPEIRCTDAIPRPFCDVPTHARMYFQATDRLSILLQISELCLLVIGSATGRVLLVTPTRMEGPNRAVYGDAWEYGFRVEAVLPRKSDEDKQGKLMSRRPLYGVAVGPAMYESEGGGSDAARPMGPKRFRVVLHYRHHEIWTYEVGRDKHEGRLCIF